METTREVHVIIPRLDLREAVAEFWHEAGVEPVRFANVREARLRLSRRPVPSLVVLDLTTASGWSLLAWLRGRERLRRVPVVAIVRQCKKIPGVLATVTRPSELASWLKVYDRVRERIAFAPAELLAVRPAA